MDQAARDVGSYLLPTSSNVQVLRQEGLAEMQIVGLDGLDYLLDCIVRTWQIGSIVTLEAKRVVFKPTDGETHPVRFRYKLLLVAEAFDKE